MNHTVNERCEVQRSGRSGSKLEGVPKQQALSVTWALVCIQAQLARSTGPKELETIQPLATVLP